MKRIVSFVRCRIWYCIGAVIFALLLMLISYMAMNIQFPLSNEKTKLLIFENLKRGIMNSHDESQWQDSLFLVDVHYDRTMVFEYDSDFGTLPIGRIPVVDRGKLYNFLAFLKDSCNYRYIVLDVLFDSKTSQASDTALYNLIASMRNIVVANSEEISLPACLNEKTGFVGYGITVWETDFTKYPLLTATNEKSLPLKMYEDLTGRRLEKHGSLYTDSGIARKSIFLTFDMEDVFEMNYLGSSLVGDTLGDSIYPSRLDKTNLKLDGKYIVIGDFEDDMHRTFVGEMAGSLINFNAFVCLKNGHHRLTIWAFLAFFAIFFFLAYFTFSQNVRFAWLCSWVGYPVYLIVMCFFMYLFFDKVYDILITTSSFYVLKFLCQRKTIIINTLFNKIKKQP